MTVKGKTAIVKRSTLKKRKASVNQTKAIAISGTKGQLSYKRLSGSKKLSINPKTGKVSVKKGTRKGAYKMHVKVTAGGDASYQAASRTVVVRVKVR